jgi:GDP-L-fucose synthase
VGQVVGYQGKIVFDVSKPDGAPRKLMDSSRINALGWRATVDLYEGLEYAYKDFLTKHGG